MLYTLFICVSFVLNTRYYPQNNNQYSNNHQHNYQNYNQLNNIKFVNNQIIKQVRMPIKLARQNIYATENSTDNTDNIDKNLNKTLPGIKSLTFDKENNIWIMNLLDDETDLSKLNPQNFNNNHNENPNENPNKFKTPDNLRQLQEMQETQETQETQEMQETQETQHSRKSRKPENYGEIVPSSKDLERLSNEVTIQWTRNWIQDMVRYEVRFPGFMYKDIFSIRDFAIQNQSDLYFYIGYFPSDMRTIHGPYYIGAFELNPRDRTFSAYKIVQNPNYMIDDKNCKKRMINFKKELRAMSEDACVFFKFSQLKNESNDRYYLTWLYEDDQYNDLYDM